MIVTDDVSQRLEDAFARGGVPVRATYVPPPESRIIEIVFPMNREYEVQQLARSEWQMVARTPDLGYTVVLRTILFHLAYEVFGLIAVGSDAFVSTNIVNLDAPRTRRRRVMSRSDGASVQWDAPVCSYDVDLVIGASSPEATRPVTERASRVAQQFNDTSRFIKIDRLRFAWVPNKTASAAQLDWRNATLQHGI